MRNMKTNQQQFEIILDYMERHGDISRPSQGTQGRREHLQKWREVAQLLNNNRATSEPKTIDKWRKTWRDLKNNTRKKLEKMQHQSDSTEMTDFEKRVLKLMGDQKSLKRMSSQVEAEVNDIVLKEEVMVELEENKLSPRNFYPDEPETSRQRITSESSYTSSNNSTCKWKPKKRRTDTSEITDIMDKYIEFERERNKMAHERELARMRQNETLMAMMGRMVDVVETLTPCLKRFLERTGDQ